MASRLAFFGLVSSINFTPNQTLPRITSNNHLINSQAICQDHLGLATGCDGLGVGVGVGVGLGDGSGVGLGVGAGKGGCSGSFGASVGRGTGVSGFGDKAALLTPRVIFGLPVISACP